jgi:hypothetical protein
MEPSNGSSFKAYQSFETKLMVQLPRKVVARGSSPDFARLERKREADPLVFLSHSDY